MGFGFDRNAASLEFVILTDQAEAALQKLEKNFDSVEEMAQKVASQFNRIFEANEKFAQFLERGGRVGDIMAATKVNVDAVTAAVDNQISRVDAAVAANRAWQAGLELNTQQMADVILVAKKFADAMGADLTDAVGTLTGAIIRGNERGLKPFGLQAGTTTEILEQLNARVKGLSGAADDAGDNVGRLRVSWDDFVDSVAEGAAADGPLSHGLGLIASLTHWMASGTTAAHTFGSALGGLAAPATTAAGAIWGLVDAMRAQYEEELSRAAAHEGNQTQIGDGADTTGDGPALGPRGTSLSFAPNASTTRTGIRTAAPTRRAGGAGGGGGGAQQADPLFARVQREQQVQAQIERLYALEAQNRRSHQQSEISAELAHNAALNRASNQRLQQRLQQNARLTQSERERLDAEQRIADAEEQINKHRMAAAFSLTEASLTAAAQLVGGLGISKSAELVLIGLVEEVKTAESIAAYDYPGAVLHETAAVLAFVNAGKAGGGGGGGGRRASARGGSASASRGREPAMGMGGGGGRREVINNTTIVIDTGGTGWVPDHVTRQIFAVQQLAQQRHGGRPS